MADDKKLAFNPAVELSCLTQEEQGMLLELMKELVCVPSLEQVARLKKYTQAQMEEVIFSLLETWKKDNKRM